jgi:hypothetical protein
MTRYDTVFLVIAGSVTGEFEDFCSEIFKNGGEIYCSETKIS